MSTGASGLLQVERVSVEYVTGRSRYLAVDEVSFGCAEGSFGAIVGGNGCGKTSLIRAVSGLQPASSGRVVLRGRPVTAATPKLWLIQQQSSLLPWLSLRRNLDFARRTAASEAGLDIEEALELVGLSNDAELFPGQLSGGMRQRGELARALVVGPDVVLMDEPFGAIDALSRRELHDRLLELRARTPVLRTGLIVTHDIAEAAQLADWVLVLGSRPGRVVGRVDIDRGGAVDGPEWRNGAAFHDACAEIEGLLLGDHLSRRTAATSRQARTP